MQSESRRERALIAACEDLARLIKDAEIPEGLVRRGISFELAEFIYNNYPFWENVDGT